jgi:hypothetical protein
MSELKVGNLVTIRKTDAQFAGVWFIVAIAGSEAWVKKTGDEFTRNEVVDLSNLEAVSSDPVEIDEIGLATGHA